MAVDMRARVAPDVTPARDDVSAPARRPVRSDPDTFDPMAYPVGYRPLFDRRPCGVRGAGTCCRDRVLWDPEADR